VKHGDNAYQREGCRCTYCVACHNARVRGNRADRLKAGRLNHGTRSAYDAGCRCAVCLDMRRAEYARSKAGETA